MRISQQIFPRPVSLIVSIDKSGRPNVMTASFLMPVSFEPKYLAFSISPQRYSFKLLTETKEFTLNVCDEALLGAAKICGTTFEKGEDKFKLAKLTKESSESVKPPTIKECPVSLECKVELMEEFGDHFLVIGRVLNEKIRKEDFRPLLHKSGENFLKVK